MSNMKILSTVIIIIFYFIRVTMKFELHTAHLFCLLKDSVTSSVGCTCLVLSMCSMWDFKSSVNFDKLSFPRCVVCLFRFLLLIWLERIEYPHTSCLHLIVVYLDLVVFSDLAFIASRSLMIVNGSRNFLSVWIYLVYLIFGTEIAQK